MLKSTIATTLYSKSRGCQPRRPRRPFARDIARHLEGVIRTVRHCCGGQGSSIFSNKKENSLRSVCDRQLSQSYHPPGGSWLLNIEEILWSPDPSAGDDFVQEEILGERAAMIRNLG